MKKEHKIFLGAVVGIVVIVFIAFMIASAPGPTTEVINVTQTPPQNQSAPVTEAQPVQPGAQPSQMPAIPQQHATPPPAATKATPATPKPTPPAAPPVQAKPQPVPASEGAGGKTLADMVSKEMPTMVDFGAEWCPACKQMRPIVDALSKEYEGRVKVIYIDLDQNKKLAADNKISAIPTQIFFDKTGKEASRHVGLYPKEQVKALFEKMGVK